LIEWFQSFILCKIITPYADSYKVNIIFVNLTYFNLRKVLKSKSIFFGLKKKLPVARNKLPFSSKYNADTIKFWNKIGPDQNQRLAQTSFTLLTP